MARITYRKTRKGETITMRADKGEDLRGVLGMKDPKKEILARHGDFAQRYGVSVADKLIADLDLEARGPQVRLANALANLLRQAVLDGALAELETKP